MLSYIHNQEKKIRLHNSGKKATIEEREICSMIINKTIQLVTPQVL
jgi:hypothetical protein